MSEPIQIRLGGYGPATTSFSLGLKYIGDRLEDRFGDGVDVKYIWNIMDFGYKAEEIFWLVEAGIISLGYQLSSYLSDRVLAVRLADLPFLFATRDAARAAVDGPFGAIMAARIELAANFRVLGFFENGFRHISNRLRPIRTPADLVGMDIRVLPSDIQAATFELLGANPMRMDLTEALAMIGAPSELSVTKQ